MNILLIDSDFLYSNNLRSLLEVGGEGVQVTIAHSAEDAIRLADEVDPNIVVMELFLVGHSGIEFIYEFRSYDDWVDIPIIILSRVDEPEVGFDDSVFTNLGVEAYVYKPDFKISSFLYLLNNILRGSDRSARF